VNIDQSIFRMAYREAESLGVAQVLIAKKRQDLELKMLRERVLEGTAASGASIDSALKRMDDESQATVRALEPDVAHQVDKTA
jgi:hypothetical protein